MRDPINETMCPKLFISKIAIIDTHIIVVEVIRPLWKQDNLLEHGAYEIYGVIAWHIISNAGKPINGKENMICIEKPGRAEI